MQQVLIKVHNDTVGPFALEHFQKLVEQGTFTGRDLVWDETSDRWLPAHRVAALKHLFPNGNGQAAPHIYAIASGKGGVGKTVTAASLGVGLATLGSEVILVDADFGGANLHTCMGILKPECNFDDFYLHNRRPLSDFVVDTPIHNLRMISGSCGSMTLANLKYHQKQRLMRALKKLPADHVIMDLGAGSDYNVIDLFLLADEPILVVSTEPTALYEAFGFVRVCLLRGLKRLLRDHHAACEILTREEMRQPGRVQLTADELLDKIGAVDREARSKAVSMMSAFEPRIILNKVRSREELKEGRAIQQAIWELLTLRSRFLGYVSYDPTVSEAVKQFKPFLLFDNKSKASQDMMAMIRVRLLGKKGLRDLFAKRAWQKRLRKLGHYYPDAKPERNGITCTDACFYWTQCDYRDPGQACPVRHVESVMAF